MWGAIGFLWGSWAALASAQKVCFGGTIPRAGWDRASMEERTKIGVRFANSQPVKR